jgi:hypothetical protein
MVHQELCLARSDGRIENYNCCCKPGLLLFLRQNPNLTLVRITRLNRIILLVYKKAYFNTNDLDFAIPSVVISLL